MLSYHRDFNRGSEKTILKNKKLITHIITSPKLYFEPTFSLKKKYI